MAIAWDKSDGWLSNPLSYEGHLSYISMQNDTSYSWQSPFRWTRAKPSSDYTNRSSKHSGGTGFILDFSSAGGEINAKFQKALINARKGTAYTPLDNNCVAPFVDAINAIHKDIGAPAFNGSHMPATVRGYIETVLVPRGFVAAEVRFPKH